MTVDVYGHLVPGANKAAVDRLDDETGRDPGVTRFLMRAGHDGRSVV
jgi:hypothetical protein